MLAINYISDSLLVQVHIYWKQHALYIPVHLSIQFIYSFVLNASWAINKNHHQLQQMIIQDDSMYHS